MFGKKSLYNILATFEKTKAELDIFVEKTDKERECLRGERAVLDQKIRTLGGEATRAGKIAEKIQELLTGE